ncbi:MAG: DNA-directed RNA polymerase subunit alpha [Clostridia bacterium]|nr:DNA-directed RNA polymerase subunit alpha [Clostridia bacterium]
MMEIEMPKISVEENDERSYVKIVVEPLEKDFGITIGNCLRRTLMSELPGAAIQGIKFDSALDVKHELSTINNVVEDVTEIILNLKTVSVKTVSTDESYKKVLRIRKEGPAIVKAGDIEADAEIEILNPEQYICTVDEGGVFDAEITIGRGRGWKNAETNKTGEIGYIAIDSNYTPVTKVCYTVENARVGQDLDKDRLILEVWTNGAFSGKEIVSLAAKILQEHISIFVNLSDIMSGFGILVSPPTDPLPKILEMSIEEMDLSVRSYNCLKRAGIHTIEDLTKKTEDDMLKVRNLGKKSLDEVIFKLNSYGLKLKEQED